MSQLPTRLKHLVSRERLPSTTLTILTVLTAIVATYVQFAQKPTAEQSFGAILLILTFLALSEVVERFIRLESIEDKLAKIVPAEKPNWIEITENVPFIDFCGNATEIFMTSVMLNRTTTFYQGFLADRLRLRASVKAVLPEIDVSFAEYDEDGALSPRDYVRKLRDIQSSLDVMLKLMEQGDFQLRFANFQPMATIFMADPSKPNGKVLYLPLLFGSYKYKRVATILDGETNKEWFENFRKRYYEDLWTVAIPATRDIIAETVRKIDARIRNVRL